MNVSSSAVGLPHNARGWLIQVALRRMTDHVRSEVARRNREAAVTEDVPLVVAPALYSELRFVNHAIASAMVHGPQAGLRLLEPLQQDPRLSGTHRVDAVRAHLLERAGEHSAAVALYRAAAAKTTNVPERNYLMLRAARLC